MLYRNFLPKRRLIGAKIFGGRDLPTGPFLFADLEVKIQNVAKFDLEKRKCKHVEQNANRPR
jgi:hypothetical protein